MSTMEIALLTALISSFSALIGVSIGSIVSLRISKRQFSATVLSANRQEWINTLRDTIAEFQSSVVMVSTDTFYKHDKPSAQDYLKKIERVSFLRAKTTLLINPSEDDHKKLVEIVDRAFTVGLSRKPDTPDEMGNLQKSLVTVAQAILKREWNRVKEGK